MNEEVLQTIPLFESLSPETRTFIASRMRTETFASGELIVRQGDTGDSLYIITNGLVKVTKRERTGESHELARLRTGDYFGEMSLLAGQPRSADIIAVTETTTLILYKEELEKLLQESPAVAMHFNKVLSKRLRDTSQMNVTAKQKVSTIALYSRYVEPSLQLTLAMNLAVSFMQELMKSVILVEASGLEAELNHLLQLDLPTASPSATNYHDAIDSDDLTPFIRCHKSGLHMLSIAAGSKLKQRTFEKDVTPLLKKLRQEYDYVLVNCAKSITRLIDTTLHQADLVMYFTPLSEEAIQRCKKDADLFVQGDRDQHELLITVIREEQQPLILSHPLEEILAPHAFMTIHKNNSILAHFISTGQPFVLEHPQANISKSLQHIARRIGRVRVGLAFGSGAARGFAHVGVFKVLEAHHIPVDMITGTSMGAFVGGFAAAGVSALELEQMVLYYRDRRKVKYTIFDLTLPLHGISKGNRLAKFMRSHLKDVTIDELPIPFAAVATDINSGQEVILRHGRLWEALRASGSVPVIFEPYMLDGRYLVDGGLTNPLPTDILIENDLDFIISSSVNSVETLSKRFSGEDGGMILPADETADHPPDKAMKKCSITNVLSRTIGIMSGTNTQSKARLADIDIRPEVSAIDWNDFHRGDELLHAGELAAEKAMPAILELLRQSRQ